MENCGVEGDHVLNHGEHHYEEHVDEMGQGENHDGHHHDGDWDEYDDGLDGHVPEELHEVDYHGEVHDGLEWVGDDVHHEDYGEHSVEQHVAQFLNKWRVFLDASLDT